MIYCSNDWFFGLAFDLLESRALWTPVFLPIRSMGRNKGEIKSRFLDILQDRCLPHFFLLMNGSYISAVFITGFIGTLKIITRLNSWVSPHTLYGEKHRGILEMNYLFFVILSYSYYLILIYCCISLRSRLFWWLILLVWL